MEDKNNQNIQDQIRRLWDKSLVIRFQTGDDSAFEEIVVEMHGRLGHFVTESFRLRLVDVEDLLQDVWLDACRGLRRLRQPGSLRPWLYRVARNKAMKYLRRRERMAELTDVQIPAPNAGTDCTLPADIHAALASLSTAHREVVLLRFEVGLSYGEIASAVGCPVGTVRSRLHHAKTSLKNTLGRFTNGD